MSSLTIPTVSAATVPRLLEVLGDQQARSADIVEVVGDDEGLSRRLLAMTNSPYLGLTRRVTDLAQAVSLLGRKTVEMVAVAGAAEIFQPRGGMPDIRQHSIETAVAAQALAAHVGVDRDLAFTAGLLHDLGEIQLWYQDPVAYRKLHRTFDRNSDQIGVELEVMGVDHATAGAERLATWGVHTEVVRAVAGHHAADADGLALLVGAADDVVQRMPHDRSRLPRLGLEPEDRPPLLAAILRGTREMNSYF